MQVKKVGVVGAGQMGTGIAQVCAQVGFLVVLVDQSAQALDSAVANIGQSLSKLANKGQIPADQAQKAEGLIVTSTKLNALAECNLVIEAVVEQEAIKADIFKQLDALLPENALLASNTSSISITRLASATKRPEKFMGVHFMNPVPLMPLVEVIKGMATSPETFNAVLAFVEALGKTPAVADDMPGFLVNRILMPMINEAVSALQDGVADIATIDTAMTLGTAQPMGPLALADLIGLDTCLAIMQVLHHGLDCTKYRPAPLLVKYVDAGFLGRKTGCGFYDYGTTPPTPQNHRGEAL